VRFDSPDVLRLHDADVPALAVEALLLAIGENPSRDGLIETPQRYVKALREMTSGYHEDPAELFKTFENDGDYDGMVSVGPVPFFSLCEHHLVPFFGDAWVAYIPGDRIVGLSKLARLVELYARRLQVQERMTEQITAAVHQHLKPEGVGVQIKARHLCMEARGIRKAGTFTVTRSLRGVFRSDSDARAEWLRGCGA
jgi:GTP cyclohydrolase I